MQKNFPGQRPHEEIFTVIHRHWFNILSHFVTLLFFGLGTLAFFFLAPWVASQLNIVLSPATTVFITTTLLLFLWVYAFFIWIDYYFDVWVITDERILNIEQRGLFTRVISEVQLEKIQDITTRVGGFIPTLLNYGDILIQSAGQEHYFHFRNVGNPDDHKEDITQLVKKMKIQNGNNQGNGDGL